MQILFSSWNMMMHTDDSIEYDYNVRLCGLLGRWFACGGE